MRAPREACLAAALVIFGGCGRSAFDPLGDRDAGVDASGCTDVVCLDPSFDGDGIATFDVGGVDNINFAYRALAVQADDKLVIGGQGGTPAATDLVVLRLTEAGALDPSFGSAGIASVDAGGTDERAIGVALDGSGRILVAGATGPAPLAGVVARLTSDGVLDPTFDGDGLIVNTVNATGPVAFNGVDVDTAGRIVVAGQAQSTDFNWIVLRMFADGTPDNTFAVAGVRSFDIGLKDQFGTLGFVTPTAIVVVGQTYNGSSFDGALLRLRAGDGAPDTTFGSYGVEYSNLGGSERFFAAALDPDRRILAAGQGSKTDDDLLVTRHTDIGIPDPSFGGAGVRYIDRSAEENLRGLVVLPDGRIVVGGHRDAGGVTVSVIAILDTAGVVLDVRDVDLGPGDDAIQDLELDHHGRVVALGSVDDASDPAITDFVIARFIVP